MKSPKISYVSKSKIYPAFGEALLNPPRIKVRKDLPNSVKKFILEHEEYHIRDWERLDKMNKEYNCFWGEIRANFYAAFKHPLGFLLCVIMSLQPYRLKLYFDRFRYGDKHYGNKE